MVYSVNFKWSILQQTLKGLISVKMIPLHQPSIITRQAINSSKPTHTSRDTSHIRVSFNVIRYSITLPLRGSVDTPIRTSSIHHIETFYRSLDHSKYLLQTLHIHLDHIRTLQSTLLTVSWSLVTQLKVPMLIGTTQVLIGIPYTSIPCLSSLAAVWLRGLPTGTHIKILSADLGAISRILGYRP